MTDNKPTMITQTGPSKMAEGIAMQRIAESGLPEDERLFYDPYAIQFGNPDMLKWIASHRVETMALAEEIEKKMPGWSNSIRTRVRYFDDFVSNEVDLGLKQIVILGAGYDTRAYRLPELEKVRIFEVDRQDTQAIKKEKMTEILGSLPDNVTFISVDLETENLKQSLIKGGYSQSKKTLFVLEGLVMYITREVVVELLSFIRGYSGTGSSVIFDFIPASMADGTSDREDAKCIRDYTIAAGEPLRSGFGDEEAVPFLVGLGFSGVYITTVEDFRDLYYHGKNANRYASNLMSIGIARVP